MKQFKLTFVLTMLLSMVGLQAFADWDTTTKIQVGDLYYYLDKDNNLAQVTSKPAKEKYSGSITIPVSFTYNTKNYNVTSIGGSAFLNCSGLTSITIPNSVKSIGSWAFYDCSGLKKVIVSDIAAWCEISFGDLSNSNFDSSNPLWHAHHLYSDENTEITNLVIPDGVTRIRQNAFRGCYGLTSITIPNSVTNIRAYAFYGCSGLTSITIPSGVTFIDDSTFQGCTSLTSITIPSSVTNIYPYAFYGCSSLTSITIPNGVVSISTSAFEECTSLTSITIPNSVIEIGQDAFYNSAWYYNQPDGLVYAGKVAYKYKGTMPKNTSITIEDGTLGIGGSAFSGSSDLTSVTIPNSMMIIGEKAFTSCYGLTSVTIPNSVIGIGWAAFWDCSGLTSVTIGNSVTWINEEAFYSCPELTSVTVFNPTPVAISNSVFPNRTNATLYVPMGCKSAYEAADYWKEFKEIIEIDPSGIEQIMSNGQNNAKIFTLDGKRISKPQKGINIINGKKVVIK